MVMAHWGPPVEGWWGGFGRARRGGGKMEVVAGAGLSGFIFLVRWAGAGNLCALRGRAGKSASLDGRGGVLSYGVMGRRAGEDGWRYNIIDIYIRPLKMDLVWDWRVGGGAEGRAVGGGADGMLAGVGRWAGWAVVAGGLCVSRAACGEAGWRRETWARMWVRVATMWRRRGRIGRFAVPGEEVEEVSFGVGDEEFVDDDVWRRGDFGGWAAEEIGEEGDEAAGGLAWHGAPWFSVRFSEFREWAGSPWCRQELRLILCPMAVMAASGRVKW